jgi:hypothetical protein
MQLNINILVLTLAITIMFLLQYRHPARDSY